MSEETQRGAEASGTAMDRHRLPRVEKDVDDPTQRSRLQPPRQESTTLTTLSRLFAVQAATSPQSSRHPSFTKPLDRHLAGRIRALQSSEIAPLPDHLYQRGLIDGAHSDITIHAFGTPYRLHRIVLDRAPFFSNALSEPWLEPGTTELTVHPEDVDISITQSSFELALKRLYGCSDAAEEDQDPIGLFTTGCWLELYDLVDSSVECMLRQMMPQTLAPLIRLVTVNYYGRAGEKILQSAKSMLCRDGWRMPIRFWDGVPAEIVREIVSGDGFFVDNECGRWFLAKRILDRRLKESAAAANLMEPGKRRKIRKAPDTANLMSVRCDSIYRKSYVQTVNEDARRWASLYTNPDVEPILDLLDEGIYYVHLTFEQLQFIRAAVDSLGIPVVPEKVLSNALWQQMELRQTILNASEVDLELGLSLDAREFPAQDSTGGAQPVIGCNQELRTTQTKYGTGDETDTVRSDSDRLRKKTNGVRGYLIPKIDRNMVMGGNADPVMNTSIGNAARCTSLSSISGSHGNERRTSELSTSSQKSETRDQKSKDKVTGEAEQPVKCSKFPPFRFSAEFPNPRLLKDRRRVYSRTVFYAGSHWNMYIKKMASSRSKQLGVYLHRAKEHESGEVIESTVGLPNASVDQRIGQLERDMGFRGMRRLLSRPSQDLHEDAADSSASADENENGTSANSRVVQPGRSNTMRSLLMARNQRKSGQVTNNNPSPNAEDVFHAASACESDNDSETEGLLPWLKGIKPHTLPLYVDARPAIRAYFKIYSPSRGGRMLSVYESAPDKFNFSQSWGWKSSSLMIDEGLTGEDVDDVSAKDDDNDGLEKDGAQKELRELNDGKLRFMVVIGNV